jgi:hypothetical protein
LKLAVAMKAIPLIALIGLILLLVDELFNWMRGNDTIIGKVLGSWEEFKQKLSNIFTAILMPIHAIGDAFFDVMGRVRNMWDSVTSWMAERISGILPQWLQRRLGFSANYEMPEPSSWSPEMVAADMQAQGGGDVRTTTLNNRADINITVPPGTTQEQVDSIRQEIDRAMERQIDNAALALEVR